MLSASLILPRGISCYSAEQAVEKARLVAQPLQLIARTRRGMSMVRDKRMELADSMSNFNRCLMFMSDVLGKVSASRKLFIVSQTLRQSFFVDNQCAKSKKPNPCPHGSCLCQKLARCATSKHACLCWCESFFYGIACWNAKMRSPGHPWPSAHSVSA